MDTDLGREADGQSAATADDLQTTPTDGSVEVRGRR
jgi:hypothetical protein